MLPIKTEMGAPLEKVATGKECLDLPIFDTGKSSVSRWQLLPWERQAIANGADLYIAQLNHGKPLQPIMPFLALKPADALECVLECEDIMKL